MKKTILFDLDGTLTDSGEGIINCAIYAMEHVLEALPEEFKNKHRDILCPMTLRMRMDWMDQKDE